MSPKAPDIILGFDKEIKRILKNYKEYLKDDFEAYVNHCTRVYIYSKTLLLEKSNYKLLVCAAFHDLDIWVNNDMNYLGRSASMAIEFAKNNKLQFLSDELKYIIENHHRVNRINDHIEAEAFRKADLIDLTNGYIKFNLPKSIIQDTEHQYPRLNFSRIILKKAINYACKNPKKPFPILKW